MPGVLYLVATPIGNLEDITFRGLKVLREADLVICEERREGDRLLRHFDISRPLETLNEHNESAATHTILQALLAGKSVAVISDCGTPVLLTRDSFWSAAPLNRESGSSPSRVRPHFFPR